MTYLAKKPLSKIEKEFTQMIVFSKIKKKKKSRLASNLAFKI